MSMKNYWRRHKDAELKSLNFLNKQRTINLGMILRFSHVTEKFRMDRSGFEPEASCLQSRRSTADLSALPYLHVKVLFNPWQKCWFISSGYKFDFNNAEWSLEMKDTEIYIYIKFIKCRSNLSYYTILSYCYHNEQNRCSFSPPNLYFLLMR